MRIVIPTEDKNGLQGKIAEHFGRCETYTLLDENGKVLEIINNTSEHMGGSGLPPELMKKHGADVLLCRGLGLKAINLCEQLGIEVYTGQAETVKELYDLWKNSKIKKAGIEDACKEHGV